MPDRNLISKICIYSFVLFTLLIFSGSCYAARWMTAATDTNGSIRYVDMDSLYKAADGTIGYWSKVVWKNERQISGETFKVKGKHIWYTKGLSFENCDSNLTSETWTQYTNYGLKNDVVTSGSSSWSGMIQPTPESVGEGVHKFVCMAWDIRQQATESPVSEPTPTYVDFSRWQVVSKLADDAFLILLDTKSLEACSSIYGNTCNVGSYGQTQGYKVWIAASDTQGKQVGVAVQRVINCKSREYDGKPILPQSQEEKIYSVLCSQ